MTLFSARKAETDMTEGRIFPLILGFALPLLLGNIFQQLYNTVDTWVVGNFVGKQAFSAVGTVGPVINTLIGFFVGFSSGAGVVISGHFGAGNTEKVEDAVHTYVAVTLILCAVMTVLGVALVSLMIRILGSPSEVAPLQHLYLVICFSGVSGLLVYNAGASILRAVGNSFYPFLFLLLTTGLNIVLDLMFVLVLGAGTAGVAWATVVSQSVSALFVVSVLLRTDTAVKIKPGKIRINREELKSIFRIGLPSAFQLSVTAFSNVFVQRYINYFGTDVMGGWTAYSKIDQLFFLPIQSIALAVTTFVSQNLGAGKTGRARRGTAVSLLMAELSIVVLVSAVMVYAESAVKFFIDDSEGNVIYWGTLFLRMNGPFFTAACINQVYGSALRGAGRSELSMINMLFSFVVFRQIYLFVVTKFVVNTPRSVGIGYPLGWVFCAVLMLVSYLWAFPREKTLHGAALHGADGGKGC